MGLLIIWMKSGRLVCLLLPSFRAGIIMFVAVQQYPLMWLHIDSAWAGSFLSCPEYREQYQLAAINKYANSLVVNFHKVCQIALMWRRNNHNWSTNIVWAGGH